MESNKTTKALVLLCMVTLFSVNAEIVHPGMINSEAELDVIRASIKNGTNPRMDEGLRYIKNAKAPTGGPNAGVKLSSLSYTPHPYAKVIPHKRDNPDDPNNSYHISRFTFTNDGRAAFYNALIWVATGDPLYAKKSIEIINSWSTVFKEIWSEDVYQTLWGSWNIPPFMYAAEILKYYKNGAAGWNDADEARFKTAMVSDFKTKQLAWAGSGLVWPNPKSGQNQNLSVQHARMLIGIYLDDGIMFTNAHKALFEELHTSDIVQEFWGRKITLMERSIGFHGEVLELNREASGDFAHAALCIRPLTELMEVVYHQGIDEYERAFYKDDEGDKKDTMPTVLNMVEYWSEGFYEKPYTLKTSYSGTVTSPWSGRNLPNYDILYNEYKYRLKEKYPVTHTQKIMDLYFTPNEQAISWATLTHGKVSKDMTVNIDKSISVSSVKSEFTMRISSAGILAITHSGTILNVTVKLFTPAGKLVKLISLTNGTTSVSLKGLNHGLYLVKYMAEGVSETQKLLLK